MTEERFAQLRLRVESNEATHEEMLEILRHADQLRDAVVDSVNERDRWDEDWDLLGYKWYVDRDAGEVDQSEALRKRHQR